MTKAKVVSTINDAVENYKRRKVKYGYGADGSNGGNQSDCSHFVNDVLNQIGFKVPYTNTASMASSPNFTQVSQANARAGDVIVQGSHMGVYTGTDYSNGLPQGAEMGNSGPALAPFGPGGWFGSEPAIFYRPISQK